MRTLSLIGSYLGLVFLLASTGVAAMAGEQKFAISDFTGRGFPPDLVEYDVKASEKSLDAMRLFDAEGKPVPCQVTSTGEKGKGLLRFVASLPANGTMSYTLRDAGGDRATGGVSIAKDGASLVLANGILAVRVPGEDEKKFEPAVAASTLSTQVLAFRHAGGAWLGKSAMLSQRKVKAQRVKLSANGSVCAEITYELEWAEGGYYRATVRVIDQVPLAFVTEEYDLNKLDGTDFWELDLASGWKPDRAQTAAHNGNGAGDPTGRIVDFAGLTQGKVQYMVGDQAWGKLSHLGVFADADAKTAPKAFPLVGVVPLRKGVWRRSNAMEVHSAGANDMRVRFPMSARYAQWPRDITSETSPFSTQENDPSLPISYGRRVWGLALGHPSIPDPEGNKPAYQLQRLYGIIGLNRYKDYTLEWPEGKVTYPRLYAGAAPSSNADGCIAALRRLCNYYFSSTCSSHHSTAANYLIAAQADSVLASPDLAPEKRRLIRSLLALIVNIYEDADMMSYGNGHHHGNPNMGTARFWSGPCFMALLPDHPQFAAWRDHMAAYGEYNAGNQVAPGGGYLEYGAAYHMHGFARTTNGIPGLRSAGASNADRLTTNYLAPDWRYYMNVLTPFDSRWGSRVIPGMANSQPGNTGHFIEAAGALAGMPELSANLAWAWEANGSFKDVNSALGAAARKPVEPSLSSQIYPGVGVIFRAHQGPQETYMFLRAGYQWSHWTVDPGHFILFSRGACLVPYQTFQYASTSDPTFDHQNTMRFGHPENAWPHGWGDSNTIDHAFGKSVDYAWASTGFPDWFIKPGVSSTWKNAPGVMDAGERKLDQTAGQVEGAFEWNRQVMFMKGKAATSPNYFVVRDTMPGEGQLASFLYLNLVGGKKNVKQEGSRIAVDTEWPTKLDVQFPDGVAQAAMHEQRFQIALHNSNIGERIGAPGTISPNWVKADGTPWEGKPTAATQENHVILRIAGAPGAGYFWLLYPRAADEPQPQVKTLAPSVMKITHPEGTDYVMLSPTPITFEGEGVSFSGRAGAVRVGASSATLVKGGGEGKVGYKGSVVSGVAAAEETFASGANEKKSIASAEPAQAAAAEKPIAPGVFKSADNSVTRYRLAAPAKVKDGPIRIEGEAGVIEISEGKVRFVAPRGAYAKLSAGNKGVRGIGPFDLTFTNDSIVGTIDGQTRSLAVTWPDNVVRPMFKMDGVRYCCGFADDHSISKGVDTPQFSIGLGVTDGKHAIEVSQWQYPQLPPEPKRRELSF